MERDGLKTYRHALEDILRSREHTLDENSERLLAMLGDAAQTPGNTFEMFESVEESPLREQFLEDAACMDAQVLFDRYFPVNTKVRLERAARRFCYRTGIYSAAKRAARKILKKD